MQIADEIDQLSRALAGGNYVVSMRVDSIDHGQEVEPCSVVGLAFPDAKLRSILAVDPTAAVSVFDRDVNYRGDRSHGPDADIFDSQRFKSLYETVRSHFHAWSVTADAVYEFEFEFDSHPFYPVMWDFAFLFMYSNRSFIWVASSSD